MSVYWSREQIERQTECFRKERTEIFTELVVRVYYYIYKECSLNDGVSCDAKAVLWGKVRDVLYEIDDYILYLKRMHYIKFRMVGDKWMIYLNRPLDFLFDGEHEEYLEDFGITGDVYFLETS